MAEILKINEDKKKELEDKQKELKEIEKIKKQYAHKTMTTGELKNLYLNLKYEREQDEKNRQPLINNIILKLKRHKIRNDLVDINTLTDRNLRLLNVGLDVKARQFNMQEFMKEINK